MGDAETKKAANIPASATSFAWAYPMVLEPGQRQPSGASEASFLTLGGYMYFDEQKRIVGTNAIQPAPLGTLGLMFGRAQPLPAAVADTMSRQGRFQEITLPFLAEQGASHFGWIRPGEFSQEVASPNGCFAYKFRDGALKYFPVLKDPVFTQELLDETLDDSEEWAVIRLAGMPTIERLVIFDTSKSLDENLMANKHVTNDLSYTSAAVAQDSAPCRSFTYQEWQQRSSGNANEQLSTLADPWVVKLMSCK